MRKKERKIERKKGESGKKREFAAKTTQDII